MRMPATRELPPPHPLSVPEKRRPDDFLDIVFLLGELTERNVTIEIPEISASRAGFL